MLGMCFGVFNVNGWFDQILLILWDVNWQYTFFLSFFLLFYFFSSFLPKKKERAIGKSILVILSIDSISFVTGSEASSSCNISWVLIWCGFESDSVDSFVGHWSNRRVFWCHTYFTSPVTSWPWFSESTEGTHTYYVSYINWCLQK